MKDVSFYLIHNNSSDRVYTRNRLKDLANNLNIDLIEIYKQKSNFKIKFTFKNKLKLLKIYFFRIFYNLKHKRDFSFKFYLLLLKSLSSLTISIVNLIFKNRHQNLNNIQHIMIEKIVTKKHIKAWKHFLKSDKDIMVIFEDDAICKKDTEKRLKDFFNRLKHFDLNNIFIDLAGGFNIEDIVQLRKIKKSKDEFFLVKGIYTNTACSYLINRNLLKKLYKEYHRSKSNHSFPIDNLINKLGLKIKNKQNLSSIHFYQPLFTHGSFEGNIKSWQDN